MSIRLAAFFGVAMVAGIVLINSEGISGYTQRLSYALGMHDWNRLKHHAVEVDPEAYIRGFLDARSGERTQLGMEEVRAILHDFLAEPDTEWVALQVEETLQGKRAAVADGGENGFVTLESGLRYRVLVAGTGDRPTLDDRVVVEYRGTLADGTEFDSTYRRGRPATFPVSQVIPGWREALQLMPAGSKWQLVVPPQLGYGKRGSGDLIGPDATLMFEVELLAITAAPGDRTQLKDIEVSFRLDPRLTRGLYMGDRWVAAPTFSGTRREGDTYTLEARVQGITVDGGRIRVDPEWIPSDPEMLQVSAAGEDMVRILVTQPGESRLKLATPGFSRELHIKATRDGNTMQVEVSR